MSTLIEIGAYEAKTRLPEYLRKVREGDAFRITQRGEPVADLVPAGTTQKHQAAQAATRMQQFMRQQQPVKGINIKALIDEGRD
ncbi:MAG: type II toxin-antitoxin system prevent-host-death family antitoxin [Azospira sp.]|jgi:prevent-host-death family protein|nr:type II toxin-antitoxin system prevent-host-death family antitoxin [Azospira sp.]